MIFLRGVKYIGAGEGEEEAGSTESSEETDAARRSGEIATVGGSELGSHGGSGEG